MDLRKIRHVSVLAAERSFVRAAAKLHITQSALSQSISRFEEELGLHLFDRTRGGALLTGPGRDFVERAADLLIAERGLAHEVTLMRGCRIGRVSFGCSPIPANAFLKPILLDIASNKPALQVHVELTNNELLLDHLLRERIALFSDTGNIPPSKRLTVRHLARVHVGFYVRKRHALASGGAKRVADLRDYPVVSLPIAEVACAKVRYWLGLSGADPLPLTMTCDDPATLKELALNSDAILLSPYSAIESECAAGKLVELTLSDLRHKGFAGICLISLARRTLSPAATMIISCVEEHLSDHGLRRWQERQRVPT